MMVYRGHSISHSLQRTSKSLGCYLSRARREEVSLSLSVGHTRAGWLGQVSRGSLGFQKKEPVALGNAGPAPVVFCSLSCGTLVPFSWWLPRSGRANTVFPFPLFGPRVLGATLCHVLFTLRRLQAQDWTAETVGAQILDMPGEGRRCFLAFAAVAMCLF